MHDAHPNRRTALALPSKGKHIAMATAVGLLGVTLPALAVIGLGNADDALAGGSIALAPIAQPKPVAPLNNETLDTPDLLAGDVPEGVNPTETVNPEQAETATAVSDVEPKRIDIPPRLRALPKAPIAGLTRQSAFGPVPSKAAGNSLIAYRRPFTPQAGKRPVSLIIGGLGVNRSLTQEAIQSFIEIPMESANFNPAEPGADRALRITLPPAENGRRLDWMLSRAQGYAGLINFNGDSFLTRADIAAPFMDRLSQTSLGFITDGAFETPALLALAKSVRQPFKTGHGLIDPDPIPRVISARLSGLGNSAKSGKHPVGVGFSYPETLLEVQNWIASLEAQNLQLAPASAALK